ncbi:hypothetical protein M5K25_016269 [Dendrobium thyrsiflorum]|uniref:Uncharacterized protein n=1 Tax=Dendrobium thyrsiflorum TaxID=117978 RepID=A0ABD0UJL7_DENTH
MAMWLSGPFDSAVWSGLEREWVDLVIRLWLGLGKEDTCRSFGFNNRWDMRLDLPMGDMDQRQKSSAITGRDRASAWRREEAAEFGGFAIWACVRRRMRVDGIRDGMKLEVGSRQKLAAGLEFWCRLRVGMQVVGLRFGQVQDNADLFLRTRNNITAILNSMSGMPGIMSQMPPLPVTINEDLVTTILPNTSQVFEVFNKENPSTNLKSTANPIPCQQVDIVDRAFMFNSPTGITVKQEPRC